MSTPQVTETHRELVCAVYKAYDGVGIDTAAKLIAEHDAQLTARAEAAERQGDSYAEQTALAITQRDAALADKAALEALVVRKDEALRFIAALPEHSREDDGENVRQMVARANEALAETPAGLSDKHKATEALCAELRDLLGKHHGFSEKHGGMHYTGTWLFQDTQAILAKTTETMGAELARLREDNEQKDDTIARVRHAYDRLSNEDSALRARVSELARTNGDLAALHDAANLRTTKAEQRAERLADALRDAKKERTDLIDGICQGVSMIREIIDEHFDEDPDEGKSYCPEGEALRDLSHHLQGTCIADDGEFMARDKFDAALSDQPAQANTREAELIAQRAALIAAHTAIMNSLPYGTPVSTEAMDAYEAALTGNALAKQGAQPVEKHDDPIAGLISFHGQHLVTNHYTYFELAYTRATGWMAWICSNAREVDPNRKILARGQGATPQEACCDALNDAARKTEGAS